MYRLILVDDEPWALSRLSKIIEWADWNIEIVATCSSGEEALEYMIKQPPDAVFTDVRMDEMTGIDLMRCAKEQHPEIEFIIVSAYSDFEAAREAIRHDACHYLLKPLDPDEVQNAVRRLLAKLDSRNRHRPVIDVAYLDDPEAMHLIERAGLYSNCYVAVSDKAAFCAEKQPGWVCMPVDIVGVPFSALISRNNSVSSSEMGAFSIPPSTLGISIAHRNFTAFSEMVHQAQVSLNCAVRYAGHPIVSAAQFYLGSNIAAAITLRELAMQFFISESYFSELFKRYAGLSVNQFIKNLRLKKATELLSGTNENVKEISIVCGYPDYGYFGKVFKKIYGLTPEQYRKQSRRN